MTRAVAVLDLAIIAAALIGILDHHAHGRTGRDTLEHAGQQLDLVRLLTLGRKARLARAAAVQVLLDHRLVYGNPGGNTVDYGADGRTMAFAPGRKAERVTEGIVAHWNRDSALVAFFEGG